MNKHEGCKRKFYWLSKSWYGKSCLKQVNYLDRITIGMYADDGGSSGEFEIEWVSINNERVPKLVAFDDSWDVLWEFRDLLEELRWRDGTTPTPEEICELLLYLGIEDATPTESPYERV